MTNLIKFYNYRKPKYRLSPYKMYGAYWSNAEQKVRVPGQFRLGNPGSALIFESYDFST